MQKLGKLVFRGSLLGTLMVKLAHTPVLVLLTVYVMMLVLFLSAHQLGVGVAVRPVEAHRGSRGAKDGWVGGSPRIAGCCECWQRGFPGTSRRISTSSCRRPGSSGTREPACLKAEVVTSRAGRRSVTP